MLCVPEDSIGCTPTPTRPVMASGLTAEFCTTAPGDDEWEALTAAMTSATRFATAPWFDAWAKSFLPYQNWRPPVQYLTVRGGHGLLRAVFPFATQKQAGISIASLGGFYWPFRSPVIPDDSGSETFDAIARAFTGSSETLVLRYGPVPEAHPGVAGLNLALEAQGWRLRRLPLGATFAVTLPPTWQQFEHNLGKSLRTNTRYYERKMRREGELEIRCARNGSGTRWAETIRDLGVIERSSWQGREGGKLRFLGEHNHAFWTRLLAESGFGRLASVWLMYFKGAPVSFCFCLDCGNIRHIVANNYAEHVHGYRTGSVLYGYVFRDAVESAAIESVNIGLGDSGYKSRWGAKPSFALEDWIAFRPGARGRLLSIADMIRRSVWWRNARSSNTGELLEPQVSGNA
jgi:hypothetical protein